MPSYQSAATKEEEPAAVVSSAPARSSTKGAIASIWYCLCVLVVVSMAYHIRLYAINTYGRVIHEFDPWFNFRATKYLADNGLYEFFHWFDHMSWYPLGRPVGTTIYPGMQITAVGLWRALQHAPASLIALLQTGTAHGRDGLSEVLSLTDVCCFMPAWFGVSTSLFIGMLTREATRSDDAGIIAAGIMAIIPAHIMRSVGGGFDNESVALTAMCSTFFFWVLSLRSRDVAKKTWLWGIVTGFAYINMVAAWGGYVFVLNMIALHAAATVAVGRYSSTLHRAYSLFFIIGTAGAIQIPVVGWVPFKSLEQLGAFAVFLVLNVIELTRYIETVYAPKGASQKVWSVRLGVFGAFGAIAAAGVAILYPTGYFGPLSARIAGLFVKHTRTGNPLVDSVAEHQPANAGAYTQYLHVMYNVAPFGFALLCLLIARERLGLASAGVARVDGDDAAQRIDAKFFLVCYAITAYFFSSKMARLIILLGPIASALSGVALGTLFEWCRVQILMAVRFCMSGGSDAEEKSAKKAAAAEKAAEKNAAAAEKKKNTKKLTQKERKNLAAKGGKTKSKKKKKGTNEGTTLALAINNSITNLTNEWSPLYNTTVARIVRVVLTLVFAWSAVGYGYAFYAYSHRLAVGMSQPSIMYQAKMRDGTKVMVDDYREAYWWLRDNTPKDARVMAWWDYGYQIAGIAERTTIADGNTWNHEHIATLGRCMASEEKEAHRMVRHLADYVLIWTGGGGDDLAKSPHMARIGNSVYDDICPGDPTCSQFGFVGGGKPTPMMAKSMLYKMHQDGIGGVHVDPQRFKLVKESRYGKVRIFKVLKVSKASRQWVKNATNRVCDAPGSWYCQGQYPPALAPIIAKQRRFRQVHDWNEKKSAKDEQYQEEYHRRMGGRN
jgi:dolichyl-diphosphooligosaccharide--protein glycosyltransferase